MYSTLCYFFSNHTWKTHAFPSIYWYTFTFHEYNVNLADFLCLSMVLNKFHTPTPYNIIFFLFITLHCLFFMQVLIYTTYTFVGLKDIPVYSTGYFWKTVIYSFWMPLNLKHFLQIMNIFTLQKCDIFPLEHNFLWFFFLIITGCYNIITNPSSTDLWFCFT